MKLSKNILSTSALVALVSFGLLGSTASAATPGQRQAPSTNTTPHPARILGRVDSVSGSGLVLQTRLGSVTVNASANTWPTARRNVRPNAPAAARSLPGSTG